MQGLFPCGRRVRLPPSGGSRMRILRLALLLALALPAAAQAEDATIVMRNVPLAGERALARRKPPARFNLVGLHWRGPGSVQFRTRSLAGRWSAWRGGCPEAEDQPDAGTAERARAGAWRLGNPWWVGPSDRIEYRLRGRVTKLRAFFVWSPTPGVPGRTLQMAGAPADPPAQRLERGREDPARCAVVRAQRCGSRSSITRPARTAYTAAQSPAIVRAIQLYHVKGNGWNDIGYNFLVDRFGQVFEGRYGGIERNVVGAHAEGFNTGSVGVSLLGSTARSRSPRRRATRSRRCSRGGSTSRTSTRRRRSRSSPAATPASRPACPSSCARSPATATPASPTAPGNQLYGLLTAARGRRRAARPAEALLAARHRHRAGHGALHGRGCRRRCRGRSRPTTRPGPLSPPGPGSAPNVDWTWDATLLPPGSYSYAIRSEDSVTPALGADRRQRRRGGPLGRGARGRPGDGLAERRRHRRRRRR